MNILQDDLTGIPEEQRAIRAKCVHPTGTFIPLPAGAIDQSIPEPGEKLVTRHRGRISRYRCGFHGYHVESDWAGGRNHRNDDGGLPDHQFEYFRVHELV